MGTQVATLLERQHGRVARRQLLAMGVTHRQIVRRLQAGRLRIVHRGVYAVAGTPATREGHWLAAVLAAGPRAVLSHRSAAELWGLIPGCSSFVHVTVPGGGGRNRRKGIVIHRSRHEVPAAHKRNIPVTPPLKTLVNVRHQITRLTFERAVSEAQRTRLISNREAETLLPDGNPTQNDFEQAFLRICRDYGIPLPRCQETVAGFQVDFFWPEQGLIVETDGRDTHGTSEAFEDDHTRDNVLHDVGYAVRRFTWRQLRQRPAWVAELVKRALARR